VLNDWQRNYGIGIVGLLARHLSQAQMLSVGEERQWQREQTDERDTSLNMTSAQLITAVIF